VKESKRAAPHPSLQPEDSDWEVDKQHRQVEGKWRRGFGVGRLTCKMGRAMEGALSSSFGLRQREKWGNGGGSDSGVAKWRWSGGGSGRGWHVARSGGDVAVAAAADRCQ
jgi:hypothetical protein